MSRHMAIGTRFKFRSPGSEIAVCPLEMSGLLIACAYYLTVIGNLRKKDVDDLMDEEGRRVVKDYKFFVTSETMKLQ